MRGALAGLVLGIAVVLSSSPALADDEDKRTVYVHNFKISKKLEADGSVFASSLCTTLPKESALDVLCEDDMSAQLSHRSQMMMLGSDDEPGGAVGAADRLGDVKVLVHGRVKQGTHGLILDITVWERDPTFDGEILKVRRKHGHIRIKGIQGGVGGVFSRLERLAPRVAALAKEEPKGPIPEGDYQ
jgi:hypothetical protein